MGQRQRVDYLRPWGCLAWAKVPSELVKLKLDPQSVKTRLVGYANSGYRLYEPRSRSIVMSRDVIFEEGTGHRSLTVLDEPEEGDQPRTPDMTANRQQPQNLIPTHQPIALRIRTDSGLLHQEPTATTEAPGDTQGPALQLPLQAPPLTRNSRGDHHGSPDLPQR